MAIWYWLMRIEEANGKIISSESKRMLESLAHLPPEDLHKLSTPDLVLRLCSARAHLQALQAQHYELREDHLSRLVEAGIVCRSN
jgi:hypothetical protein